MGEINKRVFLCYPQQDVDFHKKSTGLSDFKKGRF